MKAQAAEVPPVTIDPVLLEILWTNLQSIPDLIELDLMRTAFSPLIYEYKDYAVGIVDAQGRSIALGRGGLPGFLTNLLGLAVRDGLSIYGPDGIEPGDVLITNHAATTGQHLNNVAMYTPVHGPSGRIVGFMGIIVHWIDIGGRYPGSLGTDTTELIQEGLQLRTVKLYRRGKPVDEIFRIIEYNSRQPEELLGDIAAQYSGCVRGRGMFEDLVRRHGEETILASIAEVWRKSEAASRAALRSVPEGVYENSSFLDDDGVEAGKRIQVNIKVRIADGDFIVDYSDVSEQVKGPFNSGIHGGAESSARIAFKYLFTPTELANEGDFAPVKIIVPPGKFLSAGPTAPLSYYQTPLSTVIDTIIGALAPVMPDRVAAGHHASFGIHGFVGIHPRTGRRFRSTDTAHGGWGGSARGDGVGPYKSIRHADNRDIPIETQEARNPVIYEKYGFRPDSAGPGRRRGGLGLQKSIRVTTDCNFLTSFERFTCPPWGLMGGGRAKPGYTEMERKDGERQVYHKTSGVPIMAGERVRIYTGGGGGFGPAWEREIELVRQDVEAGFVSVEAAEQDYGVVLDPESLSVDMPATEERRRAMRAEAESVASEKTQAVPLAASGT